MGQSSQMEVFDVRGQNWCEDFFCPQKITKGNLISYHLGNKILVNIRRTHVRANTVRGWQVQSG